MVPTSLKTLVVCVFCVLLGRSKGGQTRKEQLGREGYQEMGRKGGLSTMEESGAEAAQEKGIEIDESKYRTSQPQ